MLARPSVQFRRALSHPRWSGESRRRPCFFVRFGNFRENGSSQHHRSDRSTLGGLNQLTIARNGSPAVGFERETQARTTLVSRKRGSLVSRRTYQRIALVLFVFILASCQGNGSPPPNSDSVDGSFDLSAGLNAAEVNENRLHVIEGCLIERGFAPAIEGGAIGVRSPDEQNRIVGLAMQECIDLAYSKFPHSMDYLEPPDLYEALIEVARCLRAEGYAIEEGPSRDRFVDSAGRSWHPYDDVAGAVSYDEWQRLNAACPQP